MNRHLKRALELLIVPVAAAIVVIEETLIRYLNVAMAWLARWQVIVKFEAWLVRLPPQAALLAFFAPSLLLVPVKLAALWFIAHERFVLAFLAVAAGKVIGTALVARFYRILHPTLVRLPWFARADAWFFAWRDRLYAFVRALPAWQRTAALIRQWRRRIAGMVSALFAR